MRAQSMIWRLLASVVLVVAFSVHAEEATDSTEAVAESARKSVVVIEGMKDGSISSFGSGFAVGGKDLVVTNAHVVDGCDEVLIKLYDSTSRRIGTVVRQSEQFDVAILFVPGLNAPAIPLCPVDQVSVGRRVLAIGHPQGLDFTVSDGIVSAIRKVSPDLTILQVTTPISPGSSGGPVMDLHGSALGMATLFFSQGQNLNFAVSSDTISNLLSTINQADVSNVTEEALVQPKSTPTEAVEHTPNPLGAVQIQLQSTPTPSPAVTELVKRVRAYQEKKDYGNAALLLKDGLEQFPNNIEVLLEAAYLAEEEQRFQESCAYCRKAIEINPNCRKAHITLALLMTDYGGSAKSEISEVNYQDALKHADRALSVDSLESTIIPICHAVRGYALRKLGRRSDAEREASIALVLAPTNESLRGMLREFGFEVDVRILSSHPAWKSFGLEVTGFLVNDGTWAAPNTKVIVECFDESGTLVGTGTGYATPPGLPAGSTASFSVSVQVKQELSKTHIVRILRN